MSSGIHPLNSTERLDWWRLQFTENVGPVTFFSLLSRYGTPADALNAIPTLAERGGYRGKTLKIPSLSEARKDLAQTDKLGLHYIAACEPAFPENLRVLTDCPPGIYVGGNPSLLLKPCIGIVGARNASMNSQTLAERFAHQLGEAGYVIVSGLARGIDGAAHRGSLTSGTVAVLAGGVDVIYPKEHRNLHTEILAQGCIVSEQRPRTTPQASFFPRRNRIISGLSAGVVIVEAAKASGTLITARFAAEQGREVFAVPGSPLDPRNSGSNGLLRDGAHLVETADDILSVFATLSGRGFDMPEKDYGYRDTVHISSQDIDELRDIVLSALSFDPCLVDTLIQHLGAPASHVAAALMELELAGKIERPFGNRVCLKLS